MAEERHVSFGLSGWGSVWSVDDAWFQGSHDRDIEALSIVDEIRFDQCGHDYRKLHKAIASRKSQVEDTGPIRLKTELDYLKVLAKLCEENNLRLTLCNFEHFEKEHPHIINKEKTAILLDIKYVDFRGTDKRSSTTGHQYDPQNYGYLLLADLLKGARPRADIFFVTSYGELPDDIKNMQKDELSWWWPLRTIPIVSKNPINPKADDPLEDELKAFIKYFKQGIEKDPLREFSNALLQAHTQNFTHPGHIATDVPDGFPLKEAFMEDRRQEAERDSFKALYVLDETTDGKSDRDILTRIFINHLEYAGVSVKVSGAETFRLPVEPGMLFILCLLDLHRELRLNETIQLELQAAGAKGIARMTIPLNDHEDFKSTFLTRESDQGASNALRRLLGCKTTVFEKSVNKKSAELDSRMTLWKQHRMTANSRHYKLMMDPLFNEQGLTIGWEYTSVAPRRTIFSRKSV